MLCMFLSPFLPNKTHFANGLQVFKRYICIGIQGMKRAPDWRKPLTQAVFFSKYTCI